MSDLLELNDKTLIDLLLEEEQRVATPVERLAEVAGEADRGAFQGLVPLTAPRKGEQFAFEVNLDKCSGCKGCVTACHSMNGLDDEETWRDIGLLVGGSRRHPFQQAITTACHHCVDPACLSGCPVQAYEKDPISGIVMHLDDQCIGCQYCVLKCPYDVPKYNAKRGIVRKCDMCHSRLSAGEAPACVQACPHEAIRIVTVDQEERRTAGREGRFIPGSPDPGYTSPTTRYVSDRELPEGTEAADAHALRPQPAHWPLVLMLSFSQIGVGGFLFAALFADWLDRSSMIASVAVSWIVLHFGLASSVGHLGQPLKAWRIFLGLRTSWLSREAVVLAVCSLLATVSLGVVAYKKWIRYGDWISFGPYLGPALWLTVAAGLAGALCSAYIYADTRRSYWRLPLTLGKFGGSTVLGTLAIGLVALCGSAAGTVLALLLVLLGLAKLFFEWAAFADNGLSAALASGPLRALWKARVVVGILSSGVAPVAYLVAPTIWTAALAAGWVVASEVWERALYFRAVNAPRMPGGVP